MTKFDEAALEILQVTGCIPASFCCPQCNKTTVIAKDNQTLGLSDEVKAIRIKRCRCGYEFTPDELCNAMKPVEVSCPTCNSNPCSCRIAFNKGGEENELLGL